MKKKLAALISAVAVTASAIPMFTPAYAADGDLYDVLMDYAGAFLTDGSGSSFALDQTTDPENPIIVNNEDIEIAVDMKAKRSSDSEWNDGVSNNTYSAGTSRNEVMEFDYMAKLDMSAVLDWYTRVTNLANAAIDIETAGDTAAADTLKEALAQSYVENGQFVVTVQNPDGMTFPEGVLGGGNMEGFTAQKDDGTGEVIEPDDQGRLVISGDPDDAEKGNLIYIEAERGGSNNSVTITINTEGQVSHAALAEALTYDLMLTYEGIEATGPSSYNSRKDYTLVGTVTGNTPIYVDVVEDAADPDAEPVQKQVADLTYVGVQDTSDDSLYDDADEISETVRITTSTAPSNTGGGGTSGTGPFIPISPTSTPSPSAAPELNDEDHYAYIVGYPDGSIQPNGTITRAEVATIFFRLLTDESREAYWSKTNDFSDVNIDEWYNNAISTMVSAGILNGYEDGTFNPNGEITRAEFATIAARFDSNEYSGEDQFDDISGHWASEYINRAAERGWISGYEDGTFRPDQSITRAEAMTLVNNVLNRHVQPENMLDNMVTWSDNTEDQWYYSAIQEATNSHTYERLEDGINERWLEITENRDWTALENALSSADSAE